MPISTSSSTARTAHTAASNAPIQPHRLTAPRSRLRNCTAEMPSIATMQTPHSQHTADNDAALANSTATIVTTPNDSAIAQASCSPSGRDRNPSRSSTQARQYPGASSTGANAATPRRQPATSHTVKEFTIKARSNLAQQLDHPGNPPAANL